MAPQNQIWHFATYDAFSVGARFLMLWVSFWQLWIWHLGCQLPLELLLASSPSLACTVRAFVGISYGLYLDVPGLQVHIFFWTSQAQFVNEMGPQSFFFFFERVSP